MTPEQVHSGYCACTAPSSQQIWGPKGRTLHSEQKVMLRFVEEYLFISGIEYVWHVLIMSMFNTYEIVGVHHCVWLASHT